MIALDLFCGTGWGVACKALGIEEWGVDNARAVLDTRRANGLRIAFENVWEGLTRTRPSYDLLIASPPCQTFSAAGTGAGRRALDKVLHLLQTQTYLTPDALRDFADQHGDERTALVLAPLVYAMRDRPRAIVFEQVPPVLPVWKACADELRSIGYSVWTGCLHAEQYAVPQTRRRAILIARRDGVEAAPPAPTHSRYYPRDPKRLDPDVKPWVSMAQALGWGMTARPYPTVATSRHTGGPDKEKVGGSAARAAIYDELEAGRWVHERPSTTIVGSFRPDVVAAPGYRKAGDGPRQATPGSVRVSIEQAARLQSYPADFVWTGSKTEVFRQIGNAVPPALAWAVLRGLT